MSEQYFLQQWECTLVMIYHCKYVFQEYKWEKLSLSEDIKYAMLEMGYIQIKKYAECVSPTIPVRALSLRRLWWYETFQQLILNRFSSEQMFWRWMLSWIEVVLFVLFLWAICIHYCQVAKRKNEVGWSCFRWKVINNHFSGKIRSSRREERSKEKIWKYGPSGIRNSSKSHFRHNKKKTERAKAVNAYYFPLAFGCSSPPVPACLSKNNLSCLCRNWQVGGYKNILE